jgi:hypothetical protein
MKLVSERIPELAAGSGQPGGYLSRWARRRTSSQALARTITDEQVEQVLVMTLEATPADATH